MFKVKLSVATRYLEEGQVNPLRWKTMYREGDLFTDQSGWIKCKDFFNDTVAFFKEGSVFSIYSYKNDIKKNEEGVYVLLDNIKDKNQFLHNLEVIARQCVADKFDWVTPVFPVDALPKDQILLLIPNSFWESTYYISLITKVLRLANYGVRYETWEDFWKDDAPAVRLESGFDPETIQFVNTKGFKLPQKYKRYWYFAGKQYNSQKEPKLTGGVIHNNGVNNWVTFMQMEAK